MRLLLDEMLSPTIASALRERGHDVEAIVGSPYEGAPDPEVLKIAREQRRAIVTNNIDDFRPLHHRAVVPGGGGHAGMIFMFGAYDRSKANTGTIVAALEKVLAEHPGDESLADGEAWLPIAAPKCSGAAAHP